MVELIRHHRHSIRLRGYDYSQPGAYFVTICLHGMADLLGEISEGEMKLNPSGSIVQSSWNELPRHYPHIALDSFVVMPNHVHGIIVIHGNEPNVEPNVRDTRSIGLAEKLLRANYSQ